MYQINGRKQRHTLGCLRPPEYLLPNSTRASRNCTGRRDGVLWS